MKPETTGKIKYGIWSLILGAVVAMIIGFGEETEGRPLYIYILTNF